MTFKRLLKRVLLFLWCAMLAHNSYSQAQTVSGKVQDEKGNPLPNVTITVKGTNNNTISDETGYFLIKSPTPIQTLIVSSVGFGEQEFDVAGKTDVTITLQATAGQLNEVVVIGYGTQRREEITSSIAHIKAEDFVKGPVTNPLQLIAGKVAGLQVNRPSGNPNSNPEILLRGVNSILGNNSPLIIIDGVPNASINSIQPEDVESIDVLKDASAAAIYGSQASGGVIIITTKSGKGIQQDVRVNYSGWVGFESLANKPDFLTADEYRDFYKEQQANNFVNVPKAKDMIDYGGNTNWVDAVTQTAFTHSHTLSVAGGWNKSNFSGSATYRDQEGVILTSRSKTFSTRMNFLTRTINDRLTLGASVQNTAFDDAPVPAGAWASVLARNPTIPVYNADGSYFEDINLFGVGASPVGKLKNRVAEDKGNTLLINTSATLNIGWGFKTGLQYGWQRRNQSSNSYIFINPVNGEPGTAQISNFTSTQNTINYTVEYTQAFASLHHLNVIAGYSYQDYTQRSSSILNSGFFNNLFLWNNIGAGTSIGTGVTPGRSGIGSGGFDSKLIAFFGRVNYNYSNKYMLSASIRREGSSAFGKENQWGTFPAVSLGWIISKESFMENVKLFNELKLRAGYGVTGTQPNNVTVTQNTIAPSGVNNRFYNEGNWNTIAYAPIENYNPFLKWETNKELNIGLDFDFNGNRISGSLDFYKKKIEDLIYTYNVPTPPNIFPTSVLNVGSMQNTGIELLLRAEIIKQKTFNLNSILTFSYNSNKVVSLSNDYYHLPFSDVGYIGDVFQTTTHRLVEGEAIGNFYGYTFLGFDKNGKWVLDSAGQAATNFNNATKDIIGNGIPKYTLGLTISAIYKSFDISFLLRGAFKFQVLNLYRAYYENKFQLPANILKSALDIPLYEIPKYSTYYVEDGDYVKLDNLTLGYTLMPKSGVLKSVRLYISGLNLLTITGYKGLDPEVNISGLTPGIEGSSESGQFRPVFQIYPKTRIVNIGLNVGF